MSDSRRDPEIGDLLTKDGEMIAVTRRAGKLVGWLLRYKNGNELEGMSDTDEWFRMVSEATPAGKVNIATFRGV